MNARENIIKTIRHNNPEWIPYRYDGSITLIRPKIIVRPDSGGKDDWGVNWVASNKGEGSYPDNIPVIDIKDINCLKIPDTDWHEIRKDLEKQITENKKRDTLIIVYDELVLFERAQLLLGYIEFMISQKTEEELFIHLLDTITNYQMKLVETIMDAGADGVRFTDDWGMQDRLFISPEDWRKFFKPRYQKLYGIVKRKKGFIFHHSCGYLEDIIQDIIEMDIDVIDPCQPAANNIFLWKKKYGNKLSFMGGLDTQGYLTFAKPEEVKLKVEEVLGVMSDNGGFIAAPSHTITIPEENRKMMVDTITTWNKRKTNSTESINSAKNENIKLSPSLICMDMCNLEQSINKLEEMNIDMIHIDIIDGYFSPSMPLGLDTVKQLRAKTSLPFDVHLMVNNNDFFIDEIIKTGAQRICFQYESSIHIDRLLNKIKESGAKAGVALTPSTPISVLEYTIEKCDYILLMLINPGFAGNESEKQVSYSLKKINDCYNYLKNRELEIPIEIDGRVATENIADLVCAGADVLVLGSSSLFRRGMSLDENLRAIKGEISCGIKRRTCL